MSEQLATTSPSSFCAWMSVTMSPWVASEQANISCLATTTSPSSWIWSMTFSTST